MTEDVISFLKKFGYTSCFMIGVAFTLVAIPIGYISYEIFFGMPVQTLNAPRLSSHYATLSRNSGIIDYTLSVSVDGEKIYSTGDIWGISEMQLRATLVWDKTGKVVAFERMGAIVFAYDIEDKRMIGDEELKKYCLSPMPESYTLKNQNICKAE